MPIYFAESPAHAADATPGTEGQPIPEGVVPRADVYPLETDFFTDIADTYAKAPDLSEAVGFPPIEYRFTGSSLLARYVPLDMDEAVAALAALLAEAGFAQNHEVNAVLDFQTPPEEGGMVYFRGADSMFISLAVSGEELLARYGTSRSYFAEGEWKEIQAHGAEEQDYGGLLFDRSFFDQAVAFYAKDVPEPSVPLGAPPKEISIGGERNQAAYLFIIDNAESRAESFRLTMEAAGFLTEEFSAASAVYVKEGVRVSIRIQPEADAASAFSLAEVTLTKG
jgi:hypothetical protein